MRCIHCGISSAYYSNEKHASRRNCRVAGYHDFYSWFQYKWRQFCQYWQKL